MKLAPKSGQLAQRVVRLIQSDAVSIGDVFTMDQIKELAGDEFNRDQVYLVARWIRDHKFVELIPKNKANRANKFLQGRWRVISKEGVIDNERIRTQNRHGGF